MILHQHVPAFPLNHFIESFMYYRGFQATHRMDRLLPDGNVTLIIDLQDSPQYIYDNHTLQEIQVCRNVWLSGIRSAPITIPSGHENEMFIVNFRKGRAYPFLKSQLHAYHDHVVDGELVFGNGINELRENLRDVSDVKQKFLSAERYFEKRAGRRLEENPFIVYAVSQILHAPEQQTIAAISDKVGFSQKHLIQLFKTHVGLTPKIFTRVIRFQKVINDVEKQSQIDWRQIAFDCGYYDHAHFIHDFREFSGMTPLQYLAAKNDQLNYIPVG